ncbi:MAG: hypothetical protein AAFY22_01990 [Pseudomonadota bacterium]
MGLLLRIFAVLGVLAFVAALAFGFLVYRAVQKVAPLPDEATAYADASIAAFGASWDPAVLVERSSPELTDFFAQRPGALFQMTTTLQEKLGPLKSAEPATCGDIQYLFENGDEVFTANCTTKGELEKATVQFRLSLVKRAEWKLLGFFVDPITIKPDPANRLVSADAGPPGIAPPVFTALGAEPALRSMPNVAVTLSPRRVLPIAVGANVLISAGDQIGLDAGDSDEPVAADKTANTPQN